MVIRQLAELGVSLTGVWRQDVFEAHRFVHVEHLEHVEVVLGHVLQHCIHSLLQVRFDLSHVDVGELGGHGQLELNTTLGRIIGYPL